MGDIAEILQKMTLIAVSTVIASLTGPLTQLNADS